MKINIKAIIIRDFYESKTAESETCHEINEGDTILVDIMPYYESDGMHISAKINIIPLNKDADNNSTEPLP